MQYIGWMNDLRCALRLLEKHAEEVRVAIHEKAVLERNQDLKILLMSDEQWIALQEKYEDIEPTLYQFNPEEEYGMVHTMWPEDMRGE